MCATIEVIEIDRYFNALMHILLMARNWFNKVESEILYIISEEEIWIELEVCNELFTHFHMIASKLGLNTICPRQWWRHVKIATDTINSCRFLLFLSTHEFIADFSFLYFYFFFILTRIDTYSMKANGFHSLFVFLSQFINLADGYKNVTTHFTVFYLKRIMQALSSHQTAKAKQKNCESSNTYISQQCWLWLYSLLMRCHKEWIFLLKMSQFHEEYKNLEYNKTDLSLSKNGILFLLRFWKNIAWLEWQLYFSSDDL